MKVRFVMRDSRGSRRRKRTTRIKVANEKRFLLSIVITSIVIALILFFIFVHFNGTYDEDDGTITVGPFTEIRSKEIGTKVYIIYEGNGKPYREKISLPYNTGVRIVTEIVIEEGTIELD